MRSAGKPCAPSSSVGGSSDSLSHARRDPHGGDEATLAETEWVLERCRQHGWASWSEAGCEADGSSHGALPNRHGRPQLNSVYVGGVQMAPWFFREQKDGVEVEVRSMVRHALNNRRNAVARQRYVSNILQFGVMNEMRAPPACLPCLASCGCAVEGRRLRRRQWLRTRRCFLARQWSAGTQLVGEPRWAAWLDALAAVCPSCWPPAFCRLAPGRALGEPSRKAAGCSEGLGLGCRGSLWWRGLEQ